MINPFILAISLLVVAMNGFAQLPMDTTGFAQIPMESTANPPIASPSEKDLFDDHILGHKGVEYFKLLSKQSQLYAYLFALSEVVPEMARQVEFVALFNEAHQTNQNLSHLLIALSTNNQLLEKLVQKGEAKNG